MHRCRLAIELVGVTVAVAALLSLSAAPALATSGVTETDHWVANSCDVRASLSPAPAQIGETVTFTVSIVCDYSDFGDRLGLQLSEGTAPLPLSPAGCDSVSFVSDGYLQPWRASATCTYVADHAGPLIASYTFDTLVAGRPAVLGPPVMISWNDGHCSYPPEGRVDCNGQLEGAVL